MATVTATATAAVATTMTTTIDRRRTGRTGVRPPQRLAQAWQWCLAAVCQPVPLAPLVFFRIGVGVLMLWEVWRYFDANRITRYFVEPSFLFTYYGFDFVRPMPPDAMVWLFYGLAILSFCVMIGLLYRITMPLLWLCFTYVFLLDQAQYLNHFYLMSLIFGLMIVLPAQRAWSVDAWLWPHSRSHTGPAWALGVLRAQMAIVYVYGGIAKLNADWLQGQPLRLWMSQRPDFPLLGPLMTQEWLVLAFTYGGLLLDLLIVPLLLWRYTRWPALVLMISFHVLNSQLFNIGIFPWFAIAISLLYLPPEWFRLPWRKLTPPPPPVYRPARWLFGALAVYFVVQLLLPLRHFLYAGDVSWTEEGHNVAWHMRLRDKEGELRFFIFDPASGQTQQANLHQYLTQRQIDQMTHRPDMLLQFAHFLDAGAAQQGQGDVQVFIWSMVSLNTRPPQLLIDPTIDISAQPRDLWPNPWVLPLLQPLQPQPLPMLLLTREPLALVNIGSAAIPLDGLRFQDQTNSIALDGQLNSGECLLSSERAGYVACNQVGILSPLAGPVTVWQAAEVVAACPDARCVFTIPTD
jgi:vitamin K-dependent gamma-carboxylase